jgi:hypothetical protein
MRIQTVLETLALLQVVSNSEAAPHRRRRSILSNKATIHLKNNETAHLVIKENANKTLVNLVIEKGNETEHVKINLVHDPQFNGTKDVTKPAPAVEGCKVPENYTVVYAGIKNETHLKGPGNVNGTGKNDLLGSKKVNDPKKNDGPVTKKANGTGKKDEPRKKVNGIGKNEGPGKTVNGTKILDGPGTKNVNVTGNSLNGTKILDSQGENVNGTGKHDVPGGNVNGTNAPGALANNGTEILYLTNDTDRRGFTIKLPFLRSFKIF